MARIRTVKPELFKHEELYEAEIETGLPLRIAFVGLWCVADREGRFKWRPRQIKLDVLPYDEIDFSRVLDALATRGFVVKYANGSGLFGCIPTFGDHQVINNRESESEIPSHEDAGSTIVSIGEGLDASFTRDRRVIDATLTPLEHAQVEGKGKEEEGKGKEGGFAPPASPASPPRKAEPKESPAETELQAACRETWKAYGLAFFERYGIEPKRNATINAQVKQFVQRVGMEEAPLVAAFYVRHPGQFYFKGRHQFGYALKDAEGLYTEWATNRVVTDTQARQSDRAASNANAADEAIRILEAQGVR